MSNSLDWKIGWSGRAHHYSALEQETVLEVMRTADPLTQGRYLQKFEEDLRAFIGADAVYGVTNCAHALEMAADLARIKTHDEVIIPAHTYCASAIPFGRRGAKLVWADIDPTTWLVSLKSIQKCITTKTKAVVVVHLYGMVCPEIVQIAEFLKEKHIVLIEDCAQSIGGRLNGRHCGTFGDFGCFSFHGQKNITTLGEGGALAVRSSTGFSKSQVEALRHNGHKPFENQQSYWLPAMSNIDEAFDEAGWPHNYSMSEVQAALGSVLLKRVDPMTQERRKRALLFRKRFASVSKVRFQSGFKEESSHVHHLLPVFYSGDRNRLIQTLSQEFRIKAIVQYYPLYRYDLFKKMGFGLSALVETDAYFDQMISLPFHHWMSDPDFEYLMTSFESALKKIN